MRNLLHDYQILTYKDSDGAFHKIEWIYIENLHELQTNDSLILANTLGVKHIHYKRALMKVFLS